MSWVWTQFERSGWWVVAWWLVSCLLAAGLLGMGDAPDSDTSHSPLGADDSTPYDADVCIYGATSAGVVAAVALTRLGRSVVLVEAGAHIGGMTTGGLSATDAGRRDAIGGIASEFYRAVREFYRATYGEHSPQFKTCADGYRFEPHVAAALFRGMIDSAAIPISLHEPLAAVECNDGRIERLVTKTGRAVRARVYIDATYEGDLLAEAGVSYTVGRESTRRYGEPHNGVQFGRPTHNFLRRVDPYRVPGDPQSGLLPGISSDDPGRQGDGDRRIQAYCFRLCLTRDEENRIPFPKPADYDPSQYELLLRYIKAGVWDALDLAIPLPNGKWDTNSNGAFSLDYVGASYEWPEGDEAVRRRLFHEHLTYQQGLLWFLSNDERVPEFVRRDVGALGLAKDEFRDTGGWPPILYVREARRMVSDYVVTEANCFGKRTVEDSVGLASYTMDSHNCQRFVHEGRVLNEGDVQVRIPGPFALSYRAIVPRRDECANLLVPVCVSASHIAFGSIRMEPVFMILGESAAHAAALAIEADVAVQDVSVEDLQHRLRGAGQVLYPRGS